jgi:hypothetical protein
MKVSELRGAQLDYWAGQANDDAREYVLSEGICFVRTGTITAEPYSPSTDWSQGGPIQEKREISVYYEDSRNYWRAFGGLGKFYVEVIGSTPLIAIMRCVVALVYGETVDDSQAD